LENAPFPLEDRRATRTGTRPEKGRGEGEGNTGAVTNEFIEDQTSIGAAEDRVAGEVGELSRGRTRLVMSGREKWGLDGRMGKSNHRCLRELEALDSRLPKLEDYGNGADGSSVFGS